MYDYKKMLLKSPTPLVIVELKNNRAIIKETNTAYKLYITDRYNLSIEDILTDCIVNFNYRQIKINESVYNLQIEKLEKNSFIAWFCETEQPSNEIQERLLLNVGQFDDVFLLISGGKIVFANKAYENLFEEECCIPCDIKNGFLRFIETEKENINIDYNYENIVDKRIKIKTKNEYKWVWIRSNPVKNEKNEVVASYIILTDITNRTNYVINKKENREKFFSFMSHEIKNPLNMILATMQLMEKKVEKNIYPEDILRHLDLIKRNSFRIMKIVNELTSKSKMELGYEDFNPTNQDIVCFIEDICESARDFVDINDAEIIFDTDEEEIIVGFDSEKIEKIVINLISNSLKFRKKEGAKILVSLNHDDEFIYITVKDNGIGISEENMDKIFKIYERVNDNRSIIKEGTGIGLSLVKSFANLHDGSISVKSKVGVGSEFIVKIANKLVDNDITLNSYSISKEERIQNIAVAFSDLK